jgi:hypothetical protein
VTLEEVERAIGNQNESAVFNFKGVEIEGNVGETKRQKKER